ncbi:MAG TPA: hypothetical protein VK942_16920 [Actinomycetes bacterium]|nr:hypothetical protein [Actinomycetes bacterium]
MTAATDAPVRHGPPRAASAGPLTAARLLRIELRRNGMLWMLPLLAALFWFSTYRPSMALPPLWNLRAPMLQQQALLASAPLVAGAAAWMGSREGRRRSADLVGVTALPRWAGQLATWAATTCWAIVAYLGGVAVVYGITARQATWGGPLWWPVAVGAAMMAASCALGFAAGALLPSRFSAPLVAVAVFIALGAGAIAIEHNSTYAQIWPLNVQGALPPNAFGIFSPYLPDLAITQVLFLAGLAAAVLGALGLRAAAGGRWLRCAAAVAAAAGLAAAGTGVGLAGTARPEAHGIVLPALHDAANDKPIAYTPVCSHAAVPVCLHPAYRSFLPAVTAAFGPLLSEVAGLPGAPVRVWQVAFTHLQQRPHNGIEMLGPVIGGSPPVLSLPLSGMALPGEEHTTTAEFVRHLRRQVLPMILNTLIGGGDQQDTESQQGNRSARQPNPTVLAQQAIQAAVAQVAGVPPDSGVPPLTPDRPYYAAAKRFAALPAAARHAWLVDHLTALRAGRITLGELP